MKYREIKNVGTFNFIVSKSVIIYNSLGEKIFILYFRKNTCLRIVKLSLWNDIPKGSKYAFSIYFLKKDTALACSFFIKFFLVYILMVLLITQCSKNWKIVQYQEIGICTLFFRILEYCYTTFHSSKSTDICLLK